MPTRTQTPKRGQPGRFARPSGQPGRFARPAGTSARQPAGRRRTGQSGRHTIVTRRKPQKSGTAKAFEKVGSMLSRNGKSTSPKSRGGKKGPAALAVVAGAAGLAFKNRDKLTSMVGGRRKQDDTSPSDTTPPITGGQQSGFDAGRETPPTGVPSPGGIGDVGNAADVSRGDKQGPVDADDRPLGSSGPTPG